MAKFKSQKEHHSGGGTVTYLPSAGPVSFLTSAEARGLKFHNYQLVDIVKGSGDPDNLPTANGLIYIDSVTGSGPLYDVTIKYPDYSSRDQGNNIAHPTLDDVRIGDKVLIGDDIDNSTGGSKRWYRYDVTAVGSISGSSGTSTQSGTFTVKYITDTGSGGDTSPANLFYEYDAYGASEYRMVIARETTPAAFFF